MVDDGKLQVRLDPHMLAQARGAGISDVPGRLFLNVCTKKSPRSLATSILALSRHLGPFSHWRENRMEES